MKKISGLLLVICCSTSGHALAFQNWLCGSVPIGALGSNVTMRPKNTDFPAGSSRLATLDRAVAKMNMNPSNFRMVRGASVTSAPSIGNGINDVYFDPTINADAYADPRISATGTCRLIEADIVINSTKGPWSTSEDARQLMSYGGSGRPLEATLIHEAGHVAAMDHEGRYYNMMGEDYTHMTRSGNIAKPYVGEDLSNGLVARYGLNSANIEDVSVTHWYRSGVSGGYSSHRRLPLRTTAGVAIPCTSEFWGATCTGQHYEGDPVFPLKKGQSVIVPFGFENNGKTAKTVTSRYYLSRDNTISTADTMIGEFTMTLTRNTPDYINRTLVIPNSTAIPVGNYWLGVIVDPLSQITEVNETNNTSYVRVSIK